jgi:uncharacterized cupin superfamily protein
MAQLEQKNMASPDDARSFPHGNTAFATVGGVAFALATSEPGWKWSVDVKPIAKTESCQVPHTLYQISGVMHVLMDDGSEMEIKPGDVAHVPSGHDAWVVGSEPAIAINVTPEMAESFAKAQ